jgi:hypothetical protein
MALIIQTKQLQDFFQASTIHSETLFNTVVATVTPGVSHGHGGDGGNPRRQWGDKEVDKLMKGAVVDSGKVVAMVGGSSNLYRGRRSPK